MLPTPSLLDPDFTTWLNDADGNVRAAAICWGIALSAFIILRVPREVLLGCVIVAGATVGLATTVVDMRPGPATASPSARAVVSARPQAEPPLQGAAANPPWRERPY